MSGNEVAFSRSLPFVSCALDPTPNGDRFRESYQLANQLINAADKNVMSEVARTLAIDIAYYRMKYGEMPIGKNALALLQSPTITEKQIAQLADAMAYLVAAIAMTVYEGQQETDDLKLRD